jgi:hypothetical protein
LAWTLKHLQKNFANRFPHGLAEQLRRVAAPALPTAAL